MKTTAKKHTRISLSKILLDDRALVDRGITCIVYKSDLANHRFAQHNNEKVQDATSWDQAWFAHYE